MTTARPNRASLSVVRPERASLSFAFLLYLPQLWHAARPRSECSVGGPVIICLLFHLPTFMARGPSGPAYHFLSAQFAPVIARGLSPERALCGRPSCHLPFDSFAHLYGTRPERASLSFAFLLNLPPFMRTARAGQLINALLLFIESRPADHLRGPSGQFNFFLPVQSSRLIDAGVSVSCPCKVIPLSLSLSLSRTRLTFEILSRSEKTSLPINNGKKFMGSKTGLQSSTDWSWVALVRRSFKTRDLSGAVVYILLHSTM